MGEELLVFLAQIEERCCKWLRLSAGQEIEFKLLCQLVEGRDREGLQTTIPHPHGASKCDQEGSAHQCIGCVIQGHLGLKGSDVLHRVGAPVVGLYWISWTKGGPPGVPSPHSFLDLWNSFWTLSNRRLTWRGWARNKNKESNDKVSSSGKLGGAGRSSEAPCSGGGRLVPNGSSPRWQSSRVSLSSIDGSDDAWRGSGWDTVCSWKRPGCSASDGARDGAACEVSWGRGLAWGMRGMMD
ncbi:hypothetical protein GW17_00058833 [Ensete ventricosum]|nr:hypothetical protein GW17_00058833 [Ensete ventricosum]